MFYIYKNFELQGVVTIYDSVKWTRKYNDVGEFEMEMPFTKEMFQLLEIDNVVYQKENNEACFILEKSVRTDAFGNEKLIVFGRNISCILESRIASYTGTATIKSIIDNLVNSNFINATNSKRNISNFRNQSTGLKVNPSISIKYENTDVLTIIKEICQIHQIGFKVDYIVSTKQFVFEVYEGSEKTDVMFSSTFNNVIEQEYFYSLKDNKNTCLMDNNGAITIVNDNNVGLARKETYATLSTDSTATATGQGELFLQQFNIKESMDTVIDTNSIQFFYLSDWSLGDVVTTINKGLDVTIQKNIMGIEEFFDVTGRNLVVTFGDIETVITSNGGGSTGSQGVSGTDGYTPVKGVDYFDGKEGSQGIQGEKGIQGIQGISGANGKDGVNGSQGIQGVKGDKGDTGLQGIQGIQGANGTNGINGKEGMQGAKGDVGLQGIQGIQGAKGVDGVNGKDGLTTAVKLGTTQYNQSNGIIALPLYPTTLPANGGNSTTVNGHTVNSDVPLNAKFTDTVYTHPSTHPVSMITGLPTIPTATSQLTNNSGYINASSSISGNSATSTKLQTSRTINGVGFDGTANITISATPISHTHPKSQISDMPTKLSQLIDDIGASGGEQGALIFDALAAQQGAKLKEYKVGENYVSDIRLSSNNLLLASKTESRSGTSYITVIKVYADNGTTVKQTITITEKKTSNGYETIVT